MWKIWLVFLAKHPLVYFFHNKKKSPRCLAHMPISVAWQILCSLDFFSLLLCHPINQSLFSQIIVTLFVLANMPVCWMGCTRYVVTSLTCRLDLLIIISRVPIHLGSGLPTMARLIIMLYVYIGFGIILCTASWLARYVALTYIDLWESDIPIKLSMLYR
jgi:hypothetical protein